MIPLILFEKASRIPWQTTLTKIFEFLVQIRNLNTPPGAGNKFKLPSMAIGGLPGRIQMKSTLCLYLSCSFDQLRMIFFEPFNNLALEFFGIGQVTVNNLKKVIDFLGTGFMGL